MSTYTVTNVADSGPGSLRQAILNANLHDNDPAGVLDKIVFSIGAGTRTIRPHSGGQGPLPVINDPVEIDAAPPAAFPSQVIELDGSLLRTAFPTADGLKITTGDSIVRRLTINRFPGDGIQIQTEDPLEQANDTLIEGNRIGTDVTGSIDLGNGDDGIELAGGSRNNRIGGSGPTERNVISGNGSDGIEIGPGSTNNDIKGNFIGVRATGTAALGNSGNGIRFIAAGGNTVGGTTSTARNVISANGAAGIRVSGNGSRANVIMGNYIGTDAAGAADVGNVEDGVRISAAAGETVSGNVIGGTVAGAVNVISGNNGDGVEIEGTGASSNRLEGNRIGTNAAGTAKLANGTAADNDTGAGVRIDAAPNNVIGGTLAGARNVISGNLVEGVRIENAAATGTRIQGNFIGLNAAGTAALGNGDDGVHIDGARNTTVGGTTAAARNILSGNGDDGIELQTSAASGNLIQGNYIGTNPAGSGVIPNASDGVEIQAAINNTIGGTAAGAGNLISGNLSDGIEILSDATGAATGNVIQSNRIGIAATSSANLGNKGFGIQIGTGGTNTVIGSSVTPAAGNVIAFSGLDGIFIGSATTTGVAILSNAIFSNAGLGIDLAPDGVNANDPAPDSDTGPNTKQNYPVLTSATTSGGITVVKGTLDSTANTTFKVQFFTNPTNTAADPAEGRTLLNPTVVSVTTNASGKATFSVQLFPAVAAGQFITATASNPANNTSEFSRPVTVANVTAAGSASGTVFNDADGDGVRDSGEAGISAARVWIDIDRDGVIDSGEPTLTTDTSGNYRFGGLQDGLYRLRVVQPTGTRVSLPSIGFYDLSISGGSAATGRNFGITNRLLISGTVFNDANGDRVRQSTEAGLANWRIYIDANNNGRFDGTETSTLTDSAGNWRFTHLGGGTYVVRIAPQTGFVTTTPAGGVYTVSLSGGGTRTGLLFGERRTT